MMLFYRGRSKNIWEVYKYLVGLPIGSQGGWYLFLKSFFILYPSFILVVVSIDEYVMDRYMKKIWLFQAKCLGTLLFATWLLHTWAFSIIRSTYFLAVSLSVLLYLWVDSFDTIPPDLLSFWSWYQKSLKHNSTSTSLLYFPFPNYLSGMRLSCSALGIRCFLYTFLELVSVCIYEHNWCDIFYP